MEGALPMRYPSSDGQAGFEATTERRITRLRGRWFITGGQHTGPIFEEGKPTTTSLLYCLELSAASRSVHNVRIERLWRDVRRDSLEFFRQIFLRLEAEHLLDPDSNIHLTALYLVYQPRIQKSLDETISSWNNHALRTERYKTPMAIYKLSRETAINAGYWNTEGVGDDVENVDEDYGVEGAEGENVPVDAQEPTAPRSDHFASLDDEIEAGIVVTDDEVIEEARNALHDMDLNVNDGAWGMDLYCEVVMRLTAFYEASDVE